MGGFGVGEFEKATKTAPGGEEDGQGCKKVAKCRLGELALGLRISLEV